jgi:hypothetical protein
MNGRRRWPIGVEAVFEARCAWCGPVPVDTVGLGVHVGSTGEALLEFACPACDRLNVRPLDRPDVAVLSSVGVEPLAGPAPFELLERHDGPPITWDDLIDFHQEFGRQERDAA